VLGLAPFSFVGKLIFNHSGEEKDVPDGAPLQPACEEAGVPFACTEGICGTCLIEVVEGMENLSPPNQAEFDFLGEPGRERLACQCKMKSGSVKIQI
jgi:ferredoxin